MARITKGSLMVTIETLEAFREEVLAKYDWVEDALPSNEPGKNESLRRLKRKANDLYQLIQELNDRFDA